MKIIFKTTLVAMMTIGLFSFTVQHQNLKNDLIETEGSTFKVVNNTGSKVTLKHKGGQVSLNNGSSTSLSCTREGNKIYVDGDHLHTVSSDDCGKTYKIKDWI